MKLNTIYNEDCLEGMKRIPDGSVDMILCDLPYGITACKWDIIIPFNKLWEQYNRIIKDNGAILLFGTEPFSSELRMSNIKNYRYDWLWDKVVGSNFINAKKMPLKVFENISVFYKKQPTYNPQMEERDKNKERPKTNSKVINEITNTRSTVNSTINKKKYPVNKIVFNRMSGELNSSCKSLHPTQKPVALFEYLIKTYTNEGETVLDNCMGSGTTAIACLNTNRQYIGFELDKDYYNIAQDRIKNHEQQLTLI